MTYFLALDVLQCLRLRQGSVVFLNAKFGKSNKIILHFNLLLINDKQDKVITTFNAFDYHNKLNLTNMDYRHIQNTTTTS